MGTTFVFALYCKNKTKILEKYLFLQCGWDKKTSIYPYTFIVEVVHNGLWVNINSAYYGPTNAKIAETYNIRGLLRHWMNLRLGESDTVIRRLLCWLYLSFLVIYLSRVGNSRINEHRITICEGYT